jgi:hypothetical protein
MSNKGTAVLDFGAFPGSNEASVAVTGEAAILGTSLADAWVRAEATSDHTVNDHAYVAALAAITCGVPSAGTGFTIYGRSTEKLSGTFNLDWAWA